MSRCLMMLVLCFSITAHAASFHRMVVFGDSLSDNGNLYFASGHLVPKSPPYYQGHFTNGPVWVEHLMQAMGGQLSELEDHAVGGASVVFHIKNSKLPYSLAGELAMFDMENYFTDNSDSLFVVWAGANDYLVDPASKQVHAHEVVNTIADKIVHLIKEDHARYFLVPNLPDMGVSPEARTENTVQDLREYTLLHNQYLANKLQELQSQYASKGVKIIPLDVYSLFQNVMAAPESYGILDVETPCYSGSIFDSPFALQQQRQDPKLLLAALPEDKRDFILQNPALRAAVYAAADYQQQSKMQLVKSKSSCDRKLFWDDVHPTKLIHKLLAERAVNALHAAGLHHK